MKDVNKNTIILIGFMGSGKTTIAKKLSNRLGFHFLDTDQLIEEKENRKILNIFSFDGETYFRQLERELLLELSNYSNTVISVGGGLPCYLDNMDVLLNMGLVIYLQRPGKELHQRLLQAENVRPLLRGQTEMNLLPYILHTLEEREPFYTKAHIIADRDHQSTDDLLTLIEKYPG